MAAAGHCASCSSSFTFESDSLLCPSCGQDLTPDCIVDEASTCGGGSDRAGGVGGEGGGCDRTLSCPRCGAEGGESRFELRWWSFCSCCERSFRVVEDFAACPRCRLSLADEELQPQFVCSCGCDEVRELRLGAARAGVQRMAWRYPIVIEEIEEDAGSRSVALIGKTGNGKSSLGNSLLGRPTFHVSRSFASCTAACKRDSATVGGRRITVVDTPGTMDTNDKEAARQELKKLIGFSPRGYHAFLLVLSAADRFTDEQDEAVAALRRIFGDRMLQFSILVFTSGDRFDNDVSQLTQALRTAPPSLKQLAELCGWRVAVIDNRDAAGAELLQEQLQHLLQMVDELAERNNGTYTNEFFEVAQKQLELQEKERRLKKEERRLREEREEMESQGSSQVATVGQMGSGSAELTALMGFMQEMVVDGRRQAQEARQQAEAQRQEFMLQMQEMRRETERDRRAQEERVMQMQEQANVARQQVETQRQGFMVQMADMVKESGRARSAQDGQVEVWRQQAEEARQQAQIARQNAEEQMQQARSEISQMTDRLAEVQSELDKKANKRCSVM